MRRTFDSRVFIKYFNNLHNEPSRTILRLTFALVALTTTALAQFTQPLSSPFSVGTYPYSVAVADFNRDGIPDLVFANEGATNVTVMLGNGSGGFTASTGSPFAVGSSATSVTVGDFNGDGKPDLAVACAITNQVVILLGDGAGGFSAAPGSPITVGTGPSSLAVGDFNRDGKMDLAVANFNSGSSSTITILLGNGSGGFTAGTPVAAGSGARSIGLGDFNGDGNVDLVIANQQSNNVTVLLGNGSGGFSQASGSPIGVGQSPVSISVADLNGDGKLDLVVANQTTNNLSVLLGSGSGGFSAASGSPIPAGQGTDTVAVGDFNGDGMPDIVAGNMTSGNLTILQGNGLGGFNAASYSPISMGITPTSVAVTDVDGSGVADIVVAGGSSGQGAVLLNNQAVVSPIRVAPAVGAGSNQTFTFSFTDPGGFANLSVVDVLISTFLDGQQACYFALAPASATSGYLYLVDDAGDGGYVSGTPMLLPSSGTLQNSQCALNGVGSSISGNGKTLTLTLSITFSSGFVGNKVVYMAARTNSTNSGWQSMGTWNVAGAAATGPGVGTVSPGRSTSTGQNYTFTFTDTNGYADLSVLDILTNSFLDGISACYIAYAPTGPSTGYLYLVDDAGDGGYAPGSPVLLSSGSVLQNSQCAINTAASSASASGNTLTLNLSLTFKGGFAGNQVFYLAARNNSTGNSGWQAAGSVLVP